MPPGTKRKAAKPSGSEPAIKKPRQTLDSFFSPIVPLPRKSTDDPLKATHSAALSPEQTRILRMVLDDEKSLFFTGAAGTGKSLLLRAIINGLRKKYNKDPDAIAITASTGMASSNIGGQTIHSWGAVSPLEQDFDSVIKCIRTCKPALHRWQKAKVLIIDEVSMVDARLFDQLGAIAAHLRPKSKKPFGGMQIVVTGDFFQLPPVTKNNQEPKFAFESAAWRNTLECTINLTEVFRQRDPEFVSALNSLRLGSPTPESITLFNSLSRPLPSHPILPTELFPLRALVSKSNASRLSALPTHRTVYKAVDTGTKLSLLDSLLAEERLELKVDAQVMLIKNVDDLLVNGVVGRVLGFYHQHELIAGPVIRSETPVKSTFGKSFFAKSDGSSLSTKSSTETKKHGALVRHVQLCNDRKTPVAPPAPAEDKENDSKADVKSKAKPTTNIEKYPLVLFEYPLPDGTSGTEAVLIKRDEFRQENAEGKVLARRMQLPLILAWAISIHKSQGQTIHRVKVDLGKVFERGQSYVALSRASSLAGLQVVGFNPKKVQAHPKVIEWSKTLQEIQVEVGSSDLNRASRHSL